MKNRIRVLRAERRISQEVLAKMVGISRTALVNIENEKSTPRFETIKRLSIALEVPIDQIFLA